MNQHSPTGGTTAAQRFRWVGSPWTRLGTLLLIVGSVGIGLLRNGVPTLATTQSWVADFGAWAPLLFVLVYAMATVSMLPMAVLSAFAGTLFGIPIGIVVVWCGAMLGSTAAFLLGGGRTAAAAVDPAAGAWRGFLQRHGTWAVAVTRLVPVVPLGLVNYAFAITSVRLHQYVVGTGIGIIPVTVVLVTLGDQATSLQSPVSILVVTALGVLLVGGAVLVRGRRARSTKAVDRTVSDDSGCGKDESR
ncbi:TVP38/TMEM64 family protein [Saccharopolyspora aridisoli]|uniref:TVP38/TMEM64 family membrane protein n=1 Tax=Saccharopolyspora aridisoli TaxID=2530385 RepID=A0A4R4UY19_9PSEU|nr:TVP38/TMEM64 family protein [Saccharopolyspora aridisoli]TDC95516.1 TVP38/TMEM64 family protein [Saccharopolyspora aridisoli]